MNSQEIKNKISKGFYSLGNGNLYECFIGLLVDDDTSQFNRLVESNYGNQSLDYSSVSILIEKNKELLSGLQSNGQDIGGYLKNAREKLNIFKIFLNDYYSSHNDNGEKKMLINEIDQLLNLEKSNSQPIKQTTTNIQNSLSINDLYGRSFIVNDDYIPPPPPRPLPPPPPPLPPPLPLPLPLPQPQPLTSSFNGWSEGANINTFARPHSWLGNQKISYMSVPSPLLFQPSATSIAQYPSQPSSVSIPVYLQSQQAYPSQSSSVSIPVYSQSQQAQPYGQNPITQPTWNRAYYSLQNTKSITYQQTPCSLIPISYQLLYYQKPTQLPSSYPSAPFVSVPQTAFQATNPSLSFVSGSPARVCVPTSFSSLQRMGRRIR